MTESSGPRPPSRIEELLCAVRIVWRNDPDLRLGQLIIGAANLSGREVVSPELFNLEDDQLLRGLLAFSEMRAKHDSADLPARRVELSDSEHLVLFECLHRICETRRVAISHPAEVVVLDKMAGQLERELSEPFEATYLAKLEAARAEVLESYRQAMGSESWVEDVPVEQT